MVVYRWWYWPVLSWCTLLYNLILPHTNWECKVNWEWGLLRSSSPITVKVAGLVERTTAVSCSNTLHLTRALLVSAVARTLKARSVPDHTPSAGEASPSSSRRSKVCRWYSDPFPSWIIQSTAYSSERAGSTVQWNTVVFPMEALWLCGHLLSCSRHPPVEHSRTKLAWMAVANHFLQDTQEKTVTWHVT